MSGIENWIEKLKKAEKTCLIQDGDTKFFFNMLQVKLNFYIKIRKTKNSLYIFRQNRTCGRIQLSNGRAFK